MRVGSIDATDAAPPVPPRSGPAASSTVSDPHDPELEANRLSAVVELIRTLTGREVKLVPPAAYFTSPPGSTPAPGDSARRRSPELVVAAGIDPEGPASEPIEVDITHVLREGTSDRMVLGETPSGGLALVPGLDVEL